jgi:hypothetical protein
VHLLDSSVVQREQLAGAYQQPSTVRGELDPPGAAGKQEEAELLFEASDVPAESLFGQVEPGGRTREVELFGNSHKVAKQAQVQLHGHRSPPPARTPSGAISFDCSGVDHFMIDAPVE